MAPPETLPVGKDWFYFMRAPLFLLSAQCCCMRRTVEVERPHSLDHRPPAVLQAQLQLLQDAAALLQLRCSSVGEGHVVNGEAPLLVGVQQRRDPVLVQFAPRAEDKHLLHTLVQELICPAGSQIKQMHEKNVSVVLNL